MYGAPVWEEALVKKKNLCTLQRAQRLMLLIQGTTIQRNVSCSYTARVLATPDLLTCLQSSVVKIIVTNVSKSVEVYLPYGPFAAAV